MLQTVVRWSSQIQPGVECNGEWILDSLQAIRRSRRVLELLNEMSTHCIMAYEEPFLPTFDLLERLSSE